MTPRTPRPRLDLPRSSFENVLEVLAALGLLVLLVVVTATWPKLPGTVPTHFSATGEPNNWGSKNTLLILPALGLALYVGFTILERYPHTYNYPTAVTEENAPRLYLAGRTLLTWLKLVLVCTFAVLFILIVRATETGGGLTPWPMIVVVVTCVLSTLVGLVFLLRAS